MRLATFNHMFGCNGRSLKELLHVHALYKLLQHKAIHRRSNLQKTLDVVREADADIIGITEVLGKEQRYALVQGLTTLGYNHFHTGSGHDVGWCRGHCQGTLIATRTESKLIFAPSLKLPHRFDLGGGIIGVHLPEKDLYVMYVHLPIVLFEKFKLFRLHVRVVAEKIADIQKKSPSSKIVMMGDFNCKHEYMLKHFPQLAQFKFLSSDAPTCSVTGIIKWYFQHNLDRILGVNLTPKATGMIEGYSDHKLVWVDVH